jgi:hypothetical protein
LLPPAIAAPGHDLPESHVAIACSYRGSRWRSSNSPASIALRNTCHSSTVNASITSGWAEFLNHSNPSAPATSTQVLVSHPEPRRQPMSPCDTSTPRRKHAKNHLRTALHSHADSVSTEGFGTRSPDRLRFFWRRQPDEADCRAADVTCGRSFRAATHGSGFSHDTSTRGLAVITVRVAGNQAERAIRLAEVAARRAGGRTDRS